MLVGEICRITRCGSIFDNISMRGDIVDMANDNIFFFIIRSFKNFIALKKNTL